jgi:hypothetical protein
MTKIAPRADLIAAINAVHPSEREGAIKVADATFAKSLAKLERWGDFSRAMHIDMAMDAAVAEIKFWFA